MFRDVRHNCRTQETSAQLPLTDRPSDLNLQEADPVMPTQRYVDTWMKPWPTSSKAGTSRIFVLPANTRTRVLQKAALEQVYADNQHSYFTVGRSPSKDGGRYGALCEQHSIEVRATSQLEALTAIFLKVRSLNCECPRRDA